MSRTSCAIGAALAALAIGACNDNSPNPTPGVQVALVTPTVTPNPIPTLQSSPAGPTWALTYTVTLTASGPGGEETVTEMVEVAPGCGISAFEGRSANMRAEPSANSEQVGVIGSQPRVFSSRAAHGSDGFAWYYVYHDDAIGWVRSDVVRVVDGTCPTA